jgi:AraC-like DNA-binding protein
MKDAPASSVEALDRILIDHPPDKRGRMYYGGDGPLTRILCGGFGLADTAPKLVTSLLPDVVHLDAGSSRVASWLGVTFTMLQEEAATSAPGAKAVFAKIADVFLSQALREFLIGLDERGLMTSDTLTDPAIADAIYLIHTRPSDHWTVTSLAFSVGMSRSAFSDRFRELAGQPPKRYIKKVRLTRAAGYLATTKRTLAWIASECGYESDASFSKAFKTEFGVTPGQYRATASRRPHLQAISN